MDANSQAAALAAFGMAKDLSVQLLTLSTGLIGITLLIAKDIKRQHGIWHGSTGIIAMLCFLASNVCSILVIMKLTGLLAPVTGSPILSLDQQLRSMVVWQLGIFGSGMVVFLVYAGVSLMTLRKQNGVAQP